MWFCSISTWVGRHGIYLEDLFVAPEYRGLGLGRRLLTELARICVERGYGRLEWAVLDRAHGAEPQEEWTTFRLSGAALERLAAGAAVES